MTRVHTPGPGDERPGAADARQATTSKGREGRSVGALLNTGTVEGLEASRPDTPGPVTPDSSYHDWTFALPQRLPNGRKATRSRTSGVPFAAHGTPQRYGQGCSCQPCRDAIAAYNKARRDERNSGRGTGVKKPRKPKHATSTSLEDLLREW